MMKGTRSLLVLIVLLVFEKTVCFLPNSIVSSRPSPITKFTHLQSKKTVQETKEETLSDVDSRVLKSMLEDSKLDLQNEEDIRKLLERGTVKTTKSKSKTSETDDEGNSSFSSTVLKKLADTKLWNRVSTQASNALESVGIWVANKVENDVKVLAALGLFAWNRAVRDVARALPAAGTSARRILLLTNTTSYKEPPPPPKSSLMEEMNRPEDEIKSVSKAIFDILSGEQVSPADRGLRTAAPAGTVNVAERQRRAFKQRRKLDRQEKEVTRVAGAVFDTAYELKRELQAESNPAGYKTAEVRKAIEAGVIETGNVLRAAQESARLAAARRKEQRLNAAVGNNVKAPASFNRDTIQSELQEELLSVENRLRKCIQEPEATWLRSDVVPSADDATAFQEDGLRDVVTMMFFTRDQMEVQREENETPQPEILLKELRLVKKTVDELHSRAAQATTFAIADALRSELLGLTQAESAVPLILRLDEVEENLSFVEELSDPAKSAVNEGKRMMGSDPAPWFATNQDAYNQKVEEVPPAAEIVDVIPELVVDSQRPPNSPSDGSRQAADVMDSEVDTVGASLAAEIVTDDDFDNAVGRSKAVSSVAEGEDGLEEKDENIVVNLLLRSLDVTFFVLEKTFTVGIPKALLLGKTMSTRLEDLSREGSGRKGWQLFRKSVDPKGRY